MRAILCKHWRDCGLEGGGRCAIDAFGEGSVSFGVCLDRCDAYDGPPTDRGILNGGGSRSKALEFAAAHAQLTIEGRVHPHVANHRITVCTGVNERGTKVDAPCPHYQDERGGRGTGHCRACGCRDWPISQMHVEGKGLVGLGAKIGACPGKAWFPIGCPIGRFGPQDGRRKQRKEARCSTTTTPPAAS